MLYTKKIVSIKPADVSPTCDLTVTKHHNYILENGVVTHNTFFLYEDCQAKLQRNWPSGKAFCMDEEPKRFGSGSYTIDAMMENLELTAFRRKVIDNAWVYVEQRAHRVANLFTMDAEFFT